MKKLREQDQLRVADIDAGGNPEALGLSQPEWRVTKVQSSRVDTLRVSDMATGYAGKPTGLELCIDQRAIAGAVSKHSGAKVQATGLRVIYQHTR